MHRTRPHAYGISVRPTRMLSMLMVIVVLWMLFDRVKDPATWRVLLDAKEDVPIAAAQDTASAATSSEARPVEGAVVVPGPNDLDEQEAAQAQEMLQLVSDKTPLKPREMHAYWRLMTWSRTASFTELKQRAMHDVPFTQLWEQPERYRGKLITMRLHVRRVLKYEAPSNPQELPYTYEAWGWTDESRSFPYVVVFPECPPGLPVGTDVRGEVVFVGYFLKQMSYTAFDVSRGAPLLIGRIELVPGLAKPAPAPANPSLVLWAVAIGTVVAGLAVWFQFRSRPVVRNVSRPGDLELIGSLSRDNNVGDGCMNGANKSSPQGHLELDHPRSELGLETSSAVSSSCR